MTKGPPAQHRTLPLPLPPAPVFSLFSFIALPRLLLQRPFLFLSLPFLFPEQTLLLLGSSNPLPPLSISTFSPSFLSLPVLSFLLLQCPLSLLLSSRLSPSLLLAQYLPSLHILPKRPPSSPHFPYSFSFLLPPLPLLLLFPPFPHSSPSPPPGRPQPGVPAARPRRERRPCCLARTRSGV